MSEISSFSEIGSKKFNQEFKSEKSWVTEKFVLWALIDKKKNFEFEACCALKQKFKINTVLIFNVITLPSDVGMVKTQNNSQAIVNHSYKREVSEQNSIAKTITSHEQNKPFRLTRHWTHRELCDDCQAGYH